MSVHISCPPEGLALRRSSHLSFLDKCGKEKKLPAEMRMAGRTWDLGRSWQRSFQSRKRARGQRTRKVSELGGPYAKSGFYSKFDRKSLKRF